MFIIYATISHTKRYTLRQQGQKAPCGCMWEAIETHADITTAMNRLTELEKIESMKPPKTAERGPKHRPPTTAERLKEDYRKGKR